MNKFLIVATIFSLGYMFNDLVGKMDIEWIQKVDAEVAGMDQYDLQYDWDFKRAVLQTVTDNCHVNVTDTDGYNTPVRC